MNNLYTVRDVQELINICYRIFEEYSWLLDTYVLDFFTRHHWNNLLKSWRLFVDDLPPETVGYLLDLENPLKIKGKVLPLSLICLRYTLKRVCLPRMKPEKTVLQETEKCKQPYPNPKLVNLFCKNVKLKKRHEIAELAEICYNTAIHCNCFTIIDMGAGVGHLSRMLAYSYGFKVLSIEADPVLSQQAQLQDTKFKNVAAKFLDKNKMNNVQIVYLNKRIQPDTSAEEVKEIIRNAFKISDEKSGFGIVGLHPCGDLAACLLRIYNDSENAKFINIVNCCYMKLSTPTSTLEQSFPLSSFSRDNNYKLSYNCREVACHAIEMYIERLKSGQHWELKIHAYRAAIEKLIVGTWPHLRRSHLTNIKYTQDLTFTQYCKDAVRKLGIVLDNKIIHSEESQRNLEQWSQVVKFYSLRLMLAPLIETIILLDRLLYMMESDGKCSVITAFDPKISPRNHVLVANRS